MDCVQNGLMFLAYQDFNMMNSILDSAELMQQTVLHKHCHYSSEK